MVKQTPISEINDDEPHIIRSVLRKDLTVDGSLITETLRKIDEYAGGVPYGVFTDSSAAGFPSVSRDAFAAARNVSPYPLFKAHALLVTQTGIRLIVNFFLRTFSMEIPIKMFESENEALNWVRTEVLRNSKTHVFRILITISGKVQGVFFRKHCEAEGIRLGINGYVQNKPDGSVYIDALGNGEMLTEFLKWCKKGPAKARVTSVSFAFVTAENMYSNFSIR